MEITLPQDFLLITKDKHILLDTCVFIDAISHPTKFVEFFNSLKDNNTTIVTLNEVLSEFLKGSQSEARFNEKKEYVDNIIEMYLPIRDLQDNIEKLIKLYKIESKDLSITDLYLGAALVKYNENICLLTRDVSDFPTNIFKRITYMTTLERKSITTFGVYSFLL